MKFLVISGINKGSNCGHKMFYSGAPREALICGIPSLSISLNWKQDVSCENDLEDTASVCLPLIFAAIEDIQKGIFPKDCLLNVDIPSCPLGNKGLKVSRQSMRRSSLNWQGVLASRHLTAGHFLSNQQSLGIKLAQLSRDAFAAGAVHRLNLHQKNVEIESMGVAGKFNDPGKVKKYFRLEILEKELENVEEDVDFKALEDGFVAIARLIVFNIAVRDSNISFKLEGSYNWQGRVMFPLLRAYVNQVAVTTMKADTWHFLPLISVMYRFYAYVNLEIRCHAKCYQAARVCLS